MRVETDGLKRLEVDRCWMVAFNAPVFYGIKYRKCGKKQFRGRDVSQRGSKRRRCV